MRKIILLVVVLAAGVALGIYFQKQPQAQKIETQVQTDAERTGADVKAGEQKLDAAAAEVKTGAQKAEAVATNVAAQVKTDAQKVGAAATNAAAEVKDRLN